MIETKLVIQKNNQGLFRRIRRIHSGGYLIEIARRGNGNELHYVIGNKNYEKLLWDRDNQLNSKGEEFIGASLSIKL